MKTKQQEIAALRALSVTSGAIQAVDDLLADLKKRGKTREFYNKAKQEDMRQQWITLIVRNILEKMRE